MTIYRVVFALRPDDSVGPRVEPHEVPPAPLSRPREGGDEHLSWGFEARIDGVVAWYLFDDAYALAHPEALDLKNLGLLHSLLEFKLFDDGVLIAPETVLEGSLRWPRTRAPRRTLARS